MNQLHRLAAAATLAAASLTAGAATVVVDVSGAQSVNLQGEAGNTVLLVDIGAHMLLNSIDWAVTLNAVAPSSLGEMQVSFGNSSGLDLVTFSPDAFDAGAGSYAGSLSLAGLGVATGADGQLRIEFSESFKDFALGTVEGRWTSGTLSFDVSAVPEPASALLALLGLGVVGARARRSRR